MTNTIIKTSIKKHLAGLLTAAVLGVSTAASFSSIAIADSRHESRDVKEARKDVKEARKEVKEERKDVRKADTRQERREERQDVKEAKKDVKEARHDVREERREDRNNNRNGNDHRWNNDNHSRSNRGSNNGNGYNGNGNSHVYDNYRTFTGTVTNVENGRFDIRANGQTFNVVSSRLPRGLDRGDIVRVYGERSGNNDIRNASVSIVNNR